MDADTLLRIVSSCPEDGMDDRLAGYDWFCATAGVGTVQQAAVAIAMVAEESASFHATEEFASGSEYEGRGDLGNTEPGDGVRFKGRTYIQITGRNNYGRVSRWAHKRGLVQSRSHFVDNPTDLGDLHWAWIGPACYWLGDHNHGYGSINAAADAGDLKAATYMVNGALHGFDTRKLYYDRAVELGEAILPNPVSRGVPTMIAYRVGKNHPKFYVVQDGAPVHHVSPSYARNIAVMTGQPVMHITKDMHARIVANQAAAAKGR